MFPKSLCLLMFLQSGFCSNRALDVVGDNSLITNNPSLTSKQYLIQSASSLWDSVSVQAKQCLQNTSHFLVSYSGPIRDYSIALACLSVVFLCLNTYIFLKKTYEKADSAINQVLTHASSLCNPANRGFLGRWLFGRS
jgi:hypothetical protein